LASPVPSINGIALFEQGQQPPADAVQELAYAELLRQEAVKAGLLPRHKGLTAPDLNDGERQIVETMVDGAVVTPQPTEEECQRYYEANKAQFVVGQALHLRHILFAVTPGVNVQALATHAEKALLELLHKNAPAGRFEQLAVELSNCPTSTQGGDLGWVSPEDCAPELANELFHQNHAQRGNGVHTKLMHSRFGFHIMEVMGRREGEQKTYAEVQERIAAQLTLQSRSKALRQYMSLLVGQALVEGVDLEGSDSPLVQ
jgi:peptidyl-prolyl cis-trans isomerase C